MQGLRKKRIERKLTLAEVAAANGLSVQSLSNYETGKRFPDKETLIALSNFFNCTIDDLL